MPVSKNTKIALGTGAGLVGAFLLFHQARRWWAQHKLNQLREAAVRGEISSRTFLEAALASGEPATPGGPRVTIEEAPRLLCSTIWPNPLAFPAGFQYEAALAELRRNGTCL